ncbi:MAG: hypothetical protein ACR2P2_04315 [Nakamurella sp.]
MDRRGVGLLVVVLGLLAAVVVPNAIGRTTPGVALAVPVPGPPSTGDCVGQKFDPAWDMIDADPSKYRYPELALGDCSQGHYGEVVSVIARPTKPKVVVDPGGGTSIDDNNIGTCYKTTANFLGLVDSAGKPAFLFGYWSYAIVPGVVPLKPTDRQQAAGAQWLACTVYLVNQPDVDGGSLIRYQGSLRDAVSTGIGRDNLSHCPTEADWNQATSFSCTKRHHGEIFGIGGLSQDVARATLTLSCTKLVEQVTKNPDLVRDGRLIVDVQVTDMNGNTLNGATIPKGSTLQCGVVTTGGRMLHGSLIAIGTKPIPWA